MRTEAAADGRRFRVIAGAAALLLGHWLSGPAGAQRPSWHDDHFPFRRTVDVPTGSEMPSIVVTDFYTHGQLQPDGSNLIVYGRRQVVPFRVLQVGPGDYCRVAFQPQGNESQYRIYYGGTQHVKQRERGKWAVRQGLLLETRRWRSCNLNRLEAVRSAFASSERIGSDFVPSVFHRYNPFDVKPAPFLSRYVGRLHVSSSGTITFFTTSQDCSFLLIDDKLVVAAPGRHRALRRGRFRKALKLSEGPHRFEYLHAASGTQACMVAAWQLPGMRRPQPIPPSAFGAAHIARIAATRLEHQTHRYLPDFRLAIRGDIPSPEGYPAMVRVQFGDVSGKAVTLSGKFHWDFGDGQTSQEQYPMHVYLHPGPYKVTLAVRRPTSTSAMANEVYVVRQVLVTREQERQADKLDSYIQLFDTYDPQKLDPLGLVQLVRAYLRAELPAKAARAGKAALAPQAASQTDQTRWEILTLIGPLMRAQLDDAKGAAELYSAGAKLIGRPEWRAACAIEAADTLLNDLLLPTEAKPFLELASQRLRDVSAERASKLHRVWGDWHARSGDRQAALDAYAKARAARDLSLSPTEQIAWRGAHSRSCESYLRDGQLDRLRSELERWQADFPADKVDGYLPFLQAGYWMRRSKFAQAIAVAGDLLTVNSQSPYADRLLYLSAECEQKLGHGAKAAAAYQSLVTDYPGSPLVDAARRQLKRLKRDGAARP